MKYFVFHNESTFTMKKRIDLAIIASLFAVFSCNQKNETTTFNSSEEPTELSVNQEDVVDEIANPNIVQVASASKEHTTLVAALKAAELLKSLSNAGPFTVFAPTNAAFDKLPAGTVENLMKSENKADLQNILGNHTYAGNLKTEFMQDGQKYEMVYGEKVKITKKDNKVFVNDTEILATISTANGLIYVINDVLLPK